MAKLNIIYGGPYAHESEAIIAESNKKVPNYTKLTANWNTITEGAVEAIRLAENPPEPFSGAFTSNYKPSKEEVENPPVPQVQLFTTPDEAILPQDAAKDIDNPEKLVTVEEAISLEEL